MQMPKIFGDQYQKAKYYCAERHLSPTDNVPNHYFLRHRYSELSVKWIFSLVASIETYTLTRSAHS